MMNFEKLFDGMELRDMGRESFYALHKRTSDKKFNDAVMMADILYQRGDDVFCPFLDKLAEQEGVSSEVMNLYLYLRKGEKLLDEYKRRGYDEAVFYDSMRAISVACRNNYEKKGIYGVTQPTHRIWFRRLFACAMFRFGRLEFEPYLSEFDVEIDGKKVSKGDLCIKTHIPRFESFNEELCEDSYSRAREFFKKHFGIEDVFIFCSSWLIHPWLSECLRPDSTIVNFQSKYKILTVTESPDSVIGWIYPQKCENIDDYPEQTSLQRIAKERLKKGLPLGTAMGVRL